MPDPSPSYSTYMNIETTFAFFPLVPYFDYYCHNKCFDQKRIVFISCIQYVDIYNELKGNL